MTQEEKQLLLKDLCARLPYGVKINIKSDYTREMEDTKLTSYHLDGLRYNAEYRNLRPYLRPMLSMTEDERKELAVITTFTVWTPKVYEWYLKHHFDIHKLIEKGLALEAPEGMYKKETL